VLTSLGFGVDIKTNRLAAQAKSRYATLQKPMERNKVLALTIALIVAVVFYFYAEGTGAVTMFLYGIFMLLGIENSDFGTEALYIGYILLSILIFYITYQFAKDRIPKTKTN